MAQVNNIEDPQVMGQDQNETINYDNQEYMEEYQPEVIGDQHCIASRRQGWQWDRHDNVNKGADKGSAVRAYR